jgi:hypothetical protein
MDPIASSSFLPFKLSLHLGSRALYFETQMWTQTLQNGGPIVLINWVGTQIGSGPNVKPSLDDDFRLAPVL